MSPLRAPVIGCFVESYLMAASKQHRCGNTPNHLADPCDLPSYSHSGIWLPSRAVSSQERAWRCGSERTVVLSGVRKYDFDTMRDLESRARRRSEKRRVLRSQRCLSIARHVLLCLGNLLGAREPTQLVDDSGCLRTVVLLGRLRPALCRREVTGHAAAIGQHQRQVVLRPLVAHFGQTLELARGLCQVPASVRRLGRIEVRSGRAREHAACKDPYVRSTHAA